MIAYRVCRRGVAGHPGGAQGKPVAGIGEEEAGSAIGGRGAVTVIETVERPREQDQPEAVLGARASRGGSGRGTRGGEGIGVPLCTQRRLGEKASAETVVERIQPALTLEQCTDRSPSFPYRRRTRCQQQRFGGAGFRLGQSGSQQL